MVDLVKVAVTNLQLLRKEIAFFRVEARAVELYGVVLWGAGGKMFCLGRSEAQQQNCNG